MRNFVVNQSQIVNGNILFLTLEPKSPRDMFNFVPGQYVSIAYRTESGRPSEVRCFSIVSIPDSKYLELSVKVQGDFTQSLTDLKEGDKIMVQGPFGEFVIDQHYDRNIVMLAAGIGITPFMSMIRYARKMNLPNRLVLLYSNQTDSIPFYKEIIDHQANYPRLSSAFFITRNGHEKLKGQRVVCGRISEDYLNKLTKGNYNNCSFFICGPDSFIDSMTEILENHNTDPDRIVTEKFSLAGGGSILPKSRAVRWTYAFAAVAMIAAIALISVVDLDRYIPQYEQAVASHTTEETTTNNGSSTSSVSGSNTATSSNQNNYVPPITSIS